jgi:hypothetical protein
MRGGQVDSEGKRHVWHGSDQLKLSGVFWVMAYDLCETIPLRGWAPCYVFYDVVDLGFSPRCWTWTVWSTNL